MQECAESYNQTKTPGALQRMLRGKTSLQPSRPLLSTTMRYGKRQATLTQLARLR